MKVIYDDNQIVVVIKPQNIPTQADESGDKDVLSLVKDFVKEMKFNRLGVFAYSDEEGTKAYDYEPKIDNDIANARKDEIMMIQQEISKELNKDLVGNIFDVIIDNYDLSKKEYLARSYAYAPDDADGYIYVKSDKPLNIGDIYKVEITDFNAYELKAKLKD